MAFGGARALGQTWPTVSRQVAALEYDLNVSLFERTGLSVPQTQPGIEWLEYIRSMVSGANMASLAALGRCQSIEGHALPPRPTKLSDEACA
ncbi:LysR family transcriptional regulator [Jannaschia faecimaris]|uniref:LysR family transcriptional regulator n=1 Tax=Jannaschia faecimaris TaxID=1244108 RepID=UPI000B83CD64